MAGFDSLTRRSLLAVGATGMAFAPGASIAAGPPAPPHRILSVTEFGAVGDGVTDDSAALQRALDATFVQGGTMLTVPPGDYRVTVPLRVTFAANTSGNISRHCGIQARGGRLISEIRGGEPVLHIDSRATVRYLLIDGLGIVGRGEEGHGLMLECDQHGAYLYNACLRDVTVEGCGGNGLTMTGNIFESQIANSYFRDNRGTGAMLSHGPNGGILSAIHVFGCVFGQNKEDGVSLMRGAYDVSFYGCYFLLNGRYGFASGSGCTLLNGCGFENNHASAQTLDPANMAMRLVGFGTLVACGAYSVFHQAGLIDAVATGNLIMIGCRGFGDNEAKAAGLGRFASSGGRTTLIGCQGRIDRAEGFDAIELSGDGGARFGSHWQSHNLPQLGDFRLWVDGKGRLRLKNGAPTSDEDGVAIGTS